MTYKFRIDNDCLTEVGVFKGLSGNKNVYICEFEISCDEDGSVWFAVFKKGSETYITPITGGKCTFPYECLNEPCTVYLGCYAECAGNKRISTNWWTLKVENGAYSQGTAPDAPSADLWETLLSNSVPVIGENGHWFTYDMQEKEYADTGFDARGERGEKGEKGDTGAAGYTPQKGVDYFTQEDIAEIPTGDTNVIEGVQINGTDLIADANKKINLITNTAYNESTNKLATMSDINTAVGNIETALISLRGGNAS